VVGREFMVIREIMEFLVFLEAVFQDIRVFQDLVVSKEHQ
jgi:hypothetical protein